MGSYIGTWSGRAFSSKNVILEKTESIIIFERKLEEGKNIVRQEFRYLKNKNGEHRFLMIDPDKEKSEDVHYYEKCYYAWITDLEFFRRFVDGMLRFKEITKDDYDTIQKFLKEHC